MGQRGVHKTGLGQDKAWGGESVPLAAPVGSKSIEDEDQQQGRGQQRDMSASSSSEDAPAGQR